jgi:formylglycine-generating enzyme required for sulfatase activity
MGLALAQAKSWLEKRREDLPATDQDFIYHSTVRDQRRVWRLRVLSGAMVAAIAVGLAAWFEHDYLKSAWRYVWVSRPFAAENIWPYVLTRAQEQALKPDPAKSFRECALLQQDKDYCPDMIVVPAGTFTMGSPTTENGRFPDEGPQHPVTIAKPFAVSKYLLTFAEWDTCVDHGYCEYRARDNNWGRGRQPLIYVSWNDAQQYVAWLAAMTGKPYRLLSETEYEYAARGGTQTIYPWGDGIKLNGMAMAACSGCGSPWDDKQPAPVGSFAPNAFGLYDMVGNVWEWVEDCYHESYNGAPKDGSAWIEMGCSSRVGRGGHWNYPKERIRSAFRGHVQLDYRDFTRGFRVGRALLAP